MKAEQLAITRLSSSRAMLYRSVVQRQQELDSSQELTGSFVGHNCELGQDLISLGGGDVVGAKAISTGSVTFNQPAWIALQLGSNIPITDRMPR